MNLINQYIQDILQDSIEIRKKLHQIPELKYEEFKTAELIAATLRSYGYEVKTGIAKTGIIAILDSGKPGKTIALRADMDALPIEEPASHECRSQHAGKMHACGHDGHCATLLAVANVLFRIKDQLCGKVKFVFQPAEEGGKGSSAMIDAGVLHDPEVDEIYGYHNWPGLPEGMVATRAGTILAGNGRVEITIHGKPAHTAQAQHAINPVTIGAKIITDLDNLVKDEILKNVILNIIAFNSGDFMRGMSDRAELTCVYYIDTDNDLEQLKQVISNTCSQYSQKYHIEIDVRFLPFHSPTVNSDKQSQLILNTSHEIYGDINTIKLTRSMIASEDFSEYLRYVPGCFFLVGSGELADAVHSTEYIFNDNIISVAANILCQVVLKSLLDNHASLS